jgi:hypothetical protein
LKQLAGNTENKTPILLKDISIIQLFLLLNKQEKIPLACSAQRTIVPKGTFGT